MEWTTLIQYSHTVMCDKISRTKQIQSLYMSNATENKRTMNIIKSILTFRNYYLTPNDYPYDLAPGIKHYIIWFNACTMENAVKIASICLNTCSSNIIVFVNDDKNKSILDIEHYHIFIKC
jgi:hypothetical protein